MLLLVLPWFVAITVRSGGSFFEQAIGHDMLDKVASAQEAHGAPPGYYFLLFWVTFWPGSVLAGLAAPAVWRARREPAAKFLLAWLVPSWLVFEAVITKLPHYVLPLYPAIAILIAGVVESGTLVTARWLTRGTAGWFVLPGLIAIAVPVIFIAVGHDLGIVAWPFAAVAVIFGLFAWWLYEAEGAEAALLARRGGVDLRRHHRLWRDAAVAAGAVSQRADRRGGEGVALRRAAGRQHRLVPGAEPGLPARDRARALPTASAPPNSSTTAPAASRSSTRAASAAS